MKGPNLTKVLSASGTRFCSDCGTTAGASNAYSIFLTALGVTLRFHFPLPTLYCLIFPVTVE